MSKLTTMRERRNLKQNELASVVGVSKQMINDLEHGRVYPSYGLLRKLENALNCDHREIFDSPDTNQPLADEGQETQKLFQQHNRRSSAC
jgi:transcriptional regulator with XRE-family HTH domain